MLHLATRAIVVPFIVEGHYREMPEQFQEEHSGLLCHPISLKNRGDEDYPGSSCKLLLWRWAHVLEQETCGHANHRWGEKWGLRGRSGEGTGSNWLNVLTRDVEFSLQLTRRPEYSTLFLSLCQVWPQLASRLTSIEKSKTKTQQTNQNNHLMWYLKFQWIIEWSGAGGGGSTNTP